MARRWARKFKTPRPRVRLRADEAPDEKKEMAMTRGYIPTDDPFGEIPRVLQPTAPPPVEMSIVARARAAIARAGEALE